jgi:UDP-N-acetylmuramate--alanine ligase
MERIHLIGIGGTGLSAIAWLLLEMGYAVSGSDRAESSFVRDLRSAGVEIGIGHHPENVAGADKVVRSSAVPDDDPEVTAARAAGIPVLKRADILAELMTGRTGVAVAGTHGKTTTTAMIAWMLHALKLDPSFIVGGVLKNLGVNARAGIGDVFVIEADEYDRMFLGLKPQIEVITNVEYDHPDCYPTPVDYQQAFAEFVRLLPDDGRLVACAEDSGARALIEEAVQMDKYVAAYGLRPMTTDEKISMDVFANLYFVNDKGGYTFSASVFGNPATVELQVPGKHNIHNALAALATAAFLGVPIEEAAWSLGQFLGTGRRFEVRGEAGGVTIVDDYAHHPTEIRATLSAARSRYPGRRICAVWQPHTYSRTRTLFQEFSHSFDDADEVIVTEIFAAREPRQEFSASQVVQVMSHKAVQFIAELSEVSNYLISHLRPGDVLLVLSAGDADQIGTEVLNHFIKRNSH